jgi:hypothetical protein
MLLKKGIRFSAKMLAKELGYGADGRTIAPRLSALVDSGKLMKGGRRYTVLEDVEMTAKEGS